MTSAMAESSWVSASGASNLERSTFAYAETDAEPAGEWTRAVVELRRRRWASASAASSLSNSERSTSPYAEMNVELPGELTGELAEA